MNKPMVNTGELRPECPHCKRHTGDVSYPAVECEKCGASLDICGLCANTSGNGESLDKLCAEWLGYHAAGDCTRELAKLRLSKGKLGSLSMSQRRHTLNQMKLAVEIFATLSNSTGVAEFAAFATAMKHWVEPLEALHNEGYDFLEAVKVAAEAEKNKGGYNDA